MPMLFNGQRWEACCIYKIGPKKKKDVVVQADLSVPPFSFIMYKIKRI